MGKATRWLKGLLGKIRPDPNPKDKRRFTAPINNPSTHKSSHSGAGGVRLQSAEVTGNAVDDAGRHAIAVAAASAAAAEAAVTAAQAAAAVVRLTSSGRCYAAPPARVSFDSVLEAWAALVIQSHFRGYLARRALRALKGLVKLQALVRGHIMRRKTAETMRSIEAMLRAQARARSLRAYDSPNSSEKSSQYYHPGPPTPEKLEQTFYSKNTKNTHSPMSKRSGSRSINRVIIHPDKGYPNSPGWSEPHFNESISSTRGRNPHPHHRTAASCSTEEDYYIRPDKILEIDTGKPQPQLGFKDEEDEIAFCTAENSPQFYSASSRGGTSSRRQSPMTPTKSDTSGASCTLSGYSDCPSYMAYTESSRAKMRSLSAPRQRPQLCKANAGSGRLERLGMPIRNNAVVYYSGCLN